MRALLTCCVLVGSLFGTLSLALGGNAVMLGDGSIVAMVNNREGHLQSWKAGSEKPEWTFELKAKGGMQSKVAAMAAQANDEILVIERYGSVFTIKPNGKASPRKTPAYEYIKLNREFTKEIMSNWDEHVDKVSRTAAAAVSQNAEYLYLVPNERSSVRKLSTEDILKEPNSVFFLTDFFEFMFADNNIVFLQKNDNRPIKVDHTWGLEGLHPTSLAVCKGWIIVGSAQGAVKFIPETGDVTKARFRQVSRKDGNYSILDAGCLGSNLAYTVSADFGNQLLLWDLDTQVAISSSTDSSGHPSVALVGVASKSGSHLLTLGDFDIRLWSIENKKLKLVSIYLPETKEWMLTALALSSGEFVVWDGETFWRVPSHGGPAAYYAGKKKAGQMKPCFSEPDNKVKCWSVKGPG